MLKCPKCKKNTQKGEPTASFKTYRFRKDPETGKPTNAKEIESEVKTCFGCRGEKTVNH